MYVLTQIGKEHVAHFIRECEAKRKEILDAGLDTADDTHIPTVEDIINDLNYGVEVDEEGDYYNCWGVTDNYDSDTPCTLQLYVDFIEEDSPDNLLWKILKEHYGHRVEIAIYGNPDNPTNICLEDVDTNEVILDAEIYTICAREDG